MNSLHVRLLLASVLILAAFVSLTGWALDRAMLERAQQSWFNKLQGLAYSVLAETDVDENGVLRVAESNLVEPRLNQFDSGLHAAVVSLDAQVLWQSSSKIEARQEALTHPGVGVWAFDDRSRESLPYLGLRFGFDWQLEDESVARFTVVITEDASDFLAETQRFTQTLWYWLFMAAGFLLFALLLVLRWGLRPLRQIASDLAAIEQGQAEQLEGRYPRELRHLSGNLNALLRNERQQHQRYRSALDELAHSLKTPLAVLGNLVGHREQSSDADSSDTTMTALTKNQEAREQIDRLQSQIDYHLNRAATAGPRRLNRPIQLSEGTQRVVSAMQKLHSARGIGIYAEIPDAFEARIDEGDWLELLGNLLDNAAKWAEAQVEIRVEATTTGWSLTVSDDGPGFPEAAEALLQKGVRADTRKPGQGIGLSVVTEIVTAYEAELSLGLAKLGGAEVRIVFPQ